MFYIHLAKCTANSNVMMIKITIKIYVCRQHNFIIQLKQPVVMFLIISFSVLLKDLLWRVLVFYVEENSALARRIPLFKTCDTLLLLVQAIRCRRKKVLLEAMVICHRYCKKALWEHGQTCISPGSQ